MSEKELLKKVKELGTTMSKSSAEMVRRMNCTKSKVENTTVSKSHAKNSISIGSGI